MAEHRYLLQYFHDQPHADALSSMELNLVKYARAILKVAKDLQQWTEGEYITSSGCFVLVQGVIEYLRGDYFYIVDSPVTKEIIKVDSAAASGGGSSSADLAGEVSDEEVEDELPLEDCDPLIFSEDEVASLLDSIAEFRGGGGDEDAEEAFLAFARDVAGDEAAAAFAFGDVE